MKKLQLLIFVLIAFSCTPHQESNEKKHEVQETTKENEVKEAKTSIPDFSVALQFINDYTNHCNKPAKENQDSGWIQKNQLLTGSFKERYKTLLDSAYEADPEMGLGFDPVFDAQDYPDEGFVILNSDDHTGFVTVKGINWEEFTLTLKVVLQNGQWLVDGAGIINIPVDRQAGRPD